MESVQEALAAAGFNPRAHSFRIGAVPTSSACGLNDSTIQMLGRWLSSAYLVYIQTPREQLASVSAVLSQVHAQCNC